MENIETLKYNINQYNSAKNIYLNDVKSKIPKLKTLITEVNDILLDKTKFNGIDDINEASEKLTNTLDRLIDLNTNLDTAISNCEDGIAKCNQKIANSVTNAN